MDETCFADGLPLPEGARVLSVAEVTAASLEDRLSCWRKVQPTCRLADNTLQKVGPERLYCPAHFRHEAED